MKETKPINQLISENDDNVAAAAITQCHEILKGLPTVTKMKISYNLTNGIFRLFCVSGGRKDLEDMAKEIYDGLLNEIDHLPKPPEEE